VKTNTLQLHADGNITSNTRWKMTVEQSREIQLVDISDKLKSYPKLKIGSVPIVTNMTGRQHLSSQW
jgi:hypothetical protein